MDDPSTQRPDPDELLADLKSRQTQQEKGRLKIFLGMSAGVGKTYAMLQAAKHLKGDGRDVVIGVVETHGRAETEKLVDGLECIPRRRLAYKGTQLQEMDLDAILLRKPELVLVDELAHTNVPGSRHPKRFQDVLELINAGIDVLTTLNVQHVASRSDIVRSITGIEIRETIPDSILDVASEVVLVDIAPEALLKRLGEGKVYVKDRAERAAQNFFKPGSLTALRELALRLTAEKVDHDLTQLKREQHASGPWKTSEKLCVAIGVSPTSQQLIRATRRLAYNMGAKWIAIYVETSRELSAEDQKTLSANLHLAKELGAEIVTTSDIDIVRAVLRVARQRNVSHIVVGKPVASPLKRFLGDPSPVQRLIRESGDIDVFVIEGGKGKRLRALHLLRQKIHSTPRQYAMALGFVAGAIGINYLVDPLIGYWALGLVPLGAIVLQSLFTGMGPVLLTALLSALFWNFLFIPPRFTLWISNPEDFIMLALYFVVALVTGTLATRIRSRERAFQNREQRATALFEFSRDLSQATTINELMEQIVNSLRKTFLADVAIYLRRAPGQLSRTPHPHSSWTPSEKEYAVAFWAFNNRQIAGLSTTTLSESEAIHLPLLMHNATPGVLSFKPRGKQFQLISIEEKSLLEALVNLAAVVVERELLVEGSAQSKVVEESERLHKLLLNSVSHELRTPITAIRGAIDTWLDPKLRTNPDLENSLVGEIKVATERLDRLVKGLLDISRLESGYLKARMEWCDVEDIVGVALGSFKSELKGRKILVDIETNLPLIFVDFVLIEQAIKNLIGNALTHTDSDAAIEVRGFKTKEHVVIQVLDEGPGIAQESLPHLFDKFYRDPKARPGGVGLGLSIAKGFVEAHSGDLLASNRQPKGANFIIRLPLKTQPTVHNEIDKESVE